MKSSMTKLLVTIVVIVGLAICVRHFKLDSSIVEIVISLKPKFCTIFGLSSRMKRNV